MKTPMPRAGVSTKTLQAIEDDIAAELAARDALRRLYLLLRREYRRGHLDDDDFAAAEDDLRRGLAGVERKLTQAREARQNN